MKYDTLNKKEFIELCLYTDVYQDDMFDEIKRLTNNFDKERLLSFLDELKNFGNNLKFEIGKKIPLDNGDTFISYKMITIQDFLKNHITELKEKNEFETSINSIQEIIDTTNLQKKITALKILNPECYIVHKYWNLIELYTISETEYKRTTSDYVKSEYKKIIKPKQPLTFSGLFKPEYRDRITVLLDRLQLNGYTDINNDWILKSDTNEPAKLFYYLKDRGVIIAPKIAPSIKCFYIKFGCEVVEKVNGNPRASTRRNTESAKFSVDESEFKFLLSWIDKK